MSSANAQGAKKEELEVRERYLRVEGGGDENEVNRWNSGCALGNNLCTVIKLVAIMASSASPLHLAFYG